MVLGPGTSRQACSWQLRALLLRPGWGGGRPDTTAAMKRGDPRAGATLEAHAPGPCFGCLNYFFNSFLHLGTIKLHRLRVTCKPPLCTFALPEPVGPHD